MVEMPGPKAEARLRNIGVKLDIIDHHHYTGLSRAHDAKGRLLPSSLEQFLAMFKITDRQLKSWGMNSRLVRGIGIKIAAMFGLCKMRVHKEGDCPSHDVSRFTYGSPSQSKNRGTKRSRSKNCVGGTKEVARVLDCDHACGCATSSSSLAHDRRKKLGSPRRSSSSSMGVD